MAYRDTFLQIQLRPLQHFIRRNWIHGVKAYQNRFTHQRRRRESNTSSRSEIPVWTVSQKFCHPKWGRLSIELWCRPTTTADFRSSFRQIPSTSHVCLLEDELQDWGLYLFTISYGSYAVDQRSGDGWFNGWCKIFVICKRNSNARFEVLDAKIASALNRIIHNSHFKRRISLEERKAQKQDRFLPRKTDCLPDLWVLPSHRSQRYCRE